MAEVKLVDDAAFLLPGDLFVSEAPARVKTVVGSCLAIMIRVPRLGLAAIAHCLLPEARLPAACLTRQEALRYVDTTLEIMLQKMTAHGARFDELEVKLFGGADSMGISGYRVGGRNLEVAETVLAAHGLPIAASGVGGTQGRSIEFHTESGDVFVRKLPSQGGSHISEFL